MSLDKEGEYESGAGNGHLDHVRFEEDIVHGNILWDLRLENNNDFGYDDDTVDDPRNVAEWHLGDL